MPYAVCTLVNAIRYWEIIVSYFRKQLNCFQDYPRLTGIDSKALVTE